MNKKVITSLLLFIGFFYSLYQISPLVKVDQVDLAGTNQLDAKEVKRLIPIHRGQTLAEVRKKQDQIASDLKDRVPLIKRLAFTYHKRQVNIEVIEYRPVAKFTQAKTHQRFQLLENGAVFEWTAAINQEVVPQVTHLDASVRIDQLANQLSQLDQSLLKQVVTIETEDQGSQLQGTLRLQMADQQRVLVKLSDLASRMSYYPQMTSKVKGQKGTFDLTVGAYFIPETSSKKINIDN